MIDVIIGDIIKLITKYHTSLLYASLLLFHRKDLNMTKKEMDHFRKLINGKKKELYDELGYLESSSMSGTSKDQSGDLSAYSFHMADQGTDTMDREMAFTLASREGRYLHHLNEALERIDNGSYGKCRSCECMISKARLEAVPHATQCIECKNAEEKKQRGM